jgi:hypothetical protein
VGEFLDAEGSAHDFVLVEGVLGGVCVGAVVLVEFEHSVAQVVLVL